MGEWRRTDTRSWERASKNHPQKVEENLIRHCNEAGTHRTETVRVKRYGRYGSKGR